MRIIIILLFIFISSILANNITCKDSFKKIEYEINGFKITECNCDCSMQNNKFFIKSLKKLSYKIYEISEVSKILGENTKINPLINYFIKDKKLCNDSLRFDNSSLFFFTLVPLNNSYCYELSLNINNYNEKINILKDYVELKVISIIEIKKQYLFNQPNKNSKTKMYLIKGDKVEILEEKDDWLYILYKGKKDIKAWIPKSAVQEQVIKQPINNIKEEKKSNIKENSPKTDLIKKEEKTFFTKLLELFGSSIINKNMMQS